MTTNLNGQHQTQVTIKKKTRPRRIMPPPITDRAEVLADALFSLPTRHTWVFMKGKSFRD